MSEEIRNTPLRPAIWMTGVLVWAMVVGMFLRIPEWAGYFLAFLTGASFLFYVGAYIHLLINDPDSLRRARIEPTRDAQLPAGVSAEPLASPLPTSSDRSPIPR